VHVAANIEALQATAAKPTVKQHLAAIRMLFVIGSLSARCSPSIRRMQCAGPKQSCVAAKTPVLTEEQARKLLDSIDTSTVVGLRDRALIAVMIYSFARIGAVVAMRVAPGAAALSARDRGAPTRRRAASIRRLRQRGDALFSGKAKCNNCHVEPLWTDPGWNLHTPAEICIDDFQANRTPNRRCRNRQSVSGSRIPKVDFIKTGGFRPWWTLSITTIRAWHWGSAAPRRTTRSVFVEPHFRNATDALETPRSVYVRGTGGLSSAGLGVAESGRSSAH
jgi:hypothetical protein